MNENQNTPDRDQPSGRMPDEYDRLLGQLDGLPDSLQTEDSTLRVVTLLESQQWTIRTVRLQDRDADGKALTARFVVFLETHSRLRNVRLVLPADVTEIVDRQRRSLTERAQRKAAKQAAATRKARGFVPTPFKKAKAGR